MREKIFEIVNLDGTSNGVNRAYNSFIMMVAFISVVPMMFKSGELSADGVAIIRMIDIATVIVLIFDYFMRWMTHDLKRESRGRKGGALAFVIYPFTITAIIDMLAILPTIVPIASSLIFLRLLRLGKIIRASKNLRVVANVFVHEGRTLISVFSVVGLFIFVTGLVLFLAEPGTFDTFVDALYWATAALTTIGYGDYHPVSDAGQLVNAFSALFGIIVLAIPTGIIAAGYVSETQRQRALGTMDQRPLDVGKSITARVAGVMTDVRDRIYERKRSGRTLHGYLKSHPKLARYLCVMIACAVYSCVASFVMHVTGLAYDINLFGPAVAAFYLEPAAGILVGFVNVLYACMLEQNISYIIFLGDACLLSIIFGVMLDRHKPITVGKCLRAVIVAVLLLIVLQISESLVSSWSGDSSTPWLFERLAALVLPGQSIENPTLEYALLYFAYFFVMSLLVMACSVVLVVVPYVLYRRKHPRCSDEASHVDRSKQTAQEDEPSAACMTGSEASVDCSSGTPCVSTDEGEVEGRL